MNERFHDEKVSESNPEMQAAIVNTDFLICLSDVLRDSR